MKPTLIRWLTTRRPHEPGAWLQLPAGEGRHVLITGGTGFVGKPLVNALCNVGFRVTALTRNVSRARRGLDDRVRLIGRFDQLPAAEAVHVVINIAGESLNRGRWTARRRQQLLESRIGTTRALYAALAARDHAPALLINGSAIGYYGPQGDRIVDESAAPADSFSHELCARWEEEAQRFETLGVRVCRARFGVVLGRHGGALRELLRPFVFGTAVTLGSGTQWLSWIHIDELIALIGVLVERDDLDGPFNFTAPHPAVYSELTRSLRSIVGAPLHVRMPAPVLHALLGDMADELLLQGPRVVPARLLAAGYTFRFPDIEGALRDVLQPVGHSLQR